MQQIKKQNVSQEVFQQMKKALMTGEWPKGSKIPSENELARSMQVSRVSVREAIQRLSTLGLLESRQGEGTFVCEFVGTQYIDSLLSFAVTNKESVLYMCEFRNVIECESVALAAERATNEDIAALKEIYQRHASLDRAMGDELYITTASGLDLEFHFQIGKATQNPIICQVYETMQPLWEQTMSQIIAVMDVQRAIFFHDRLISAIENHNPESARQIMKDHLQQNIEAIIAQKLIFARY